MIGTEDTVTLDELQWIHEAEAAFVQIGFDGQVIAMSAPEGRGNA